MLLSTRIAILCFKEVWRLLVGVVVDPFTKMIGQVKSSVVIGAILKVNGYQAVGRVAGVIPQQNVTLLQVIVAKGHWRVHFEQEFPKNTSRNKLININFSSKRILLYEHENNGKQCNAKNADQQIFFR